MAKNAKQPQPTNRPEKKFGPYSAGLGLAIWLNQIETDQGPKLVRSITINPRRYRDANTGEWKDSGSFRQQDIPILIHALQQAYAYCLETPVADHQEDEHG